MPGVCNHRLIGKQPPPAVHEFSQDVQVPCATRHSRRRLFGKQRPPMPETLKRAAQTSFLRQACEKGTTEETPLEFTSPLESSKTGSPARVSKRDHEPITGGSEPCSTESRAIRKRQRVFVQALETAVDQEPLVTVATSVRDSLAERRASCTSEAIARDKLDVVNGVIAADEGAPADATILLGQVAATGNVGVADSAATTEIQSASDKTGQTDEHSVPEGSKAQSPVEANAAIAATLAGTLASADSVRTAIPGILNSLTEFATGHCIPERVVREVIDSLAPFPLQAREDDVAKKQAPQKRALILSALDMLTAHFHQERPIAAVVPAVLESIGTLPTPLIESDETRQENISDENSPASKRRREEWEEMTHIEPGTYLSGPVSEEEEIARQQELQQHRLWEQDQVADLEIGSAMGTCKMLEDSSEDQVAELESGSRTGKREMLEDSSEDSGAIAIIPVAPKYPFIKEDLVEDLDAWIQRSMNKLQ